MSLNFYGKGRPIARVVGGKDDGTEVYVSTDPNGTKSIKIADGGKFQLIPDTKTERQIHYITGASGSGKSYFTGKFVKEYKKKNKKNPVFVFSRLNEDKELDNLKPLRIKIGDNLVNEPIQPDDLDNSICIFDDTDVIPDKLLKNEVDKIRDQVLEIGRHHKTSAIITNHLPTGRDLKRVLNECHTITFFPMNYNRQQKYMLENYLGLDKKQIKKIRGSGSRWCCCLRHYPQVVLLEKECYMNMPNFDDL